MRKNSFLLIFFLVLIYWRWFLPFSHVGNDLHITFSENLLEQFNVPYTWGARGAVGLGEYAAPILWFWPVDAIFGFLGNLGFSHNFLNQVFGVGAILFLGVIGTTRLLDYLKITKKGKWLGTLFYLINTYFLILIDGGQLAIALAYAWMPIAYLAILKSIKGKLKNKILAGVTVAILGLFDIRFIYIIFLLLILRFLYELLFLSRRDLICWISSWLKSGVIIGLVFVGLHSYWLVLAIFVRAPALPATYGRVAQASFLSFSTLGHSLFLLQPHWYKNVFGKVIAIKPEFVLIPMLVFLAPVLRRKNRVVGFWLLVSLVSVFLVKGTFGPLPEIYPWLFTNIPGFSLFRDPTKFYFLIALSYSVLLAITIDELSKRFSWKISLLGKKILVIPLLIAAYFVLLVSPVYMGKMTGTFSEPAYQKEFLKTNNTIDSDKEFGRVFWMPTKAPLGFSSPSHSSVEASRLVQKRPFMAGVVGTYETFNFLREAPFMGELFDIAAIKYIAYPYPDTRREELKQDNIDYYYSFLDQLSSLSWIDGKLSDPPVSLLETNSSQDHLFISPNTFLIFGSDKIYWDLMEIPDFKLAQNALIFAEEKAGIGKIAETIHHAKIILYDEDNTDLVASFLPADNFVFPANNLDFDPDETGWWKREAPDLIRWRAFLQEKYGLDNLDFDYGGGWAVAEGEKQLMISNEVFVEGDKLLVRLMESSKGGRVDFYQEERMIASINTKFDQPDEVEIKLTGYGEIPDQIFKYNDSNFAWFEVGNLTQDGEITIKTQGDINVINALASVPDNDWSSLREKTAELIGKGKVYVWDDLSKEGKQELFKAENKTEVSYERLSPTHYKVKVKGIEEPVTLSFSETYDSLWEINGKPGYPLYSLINGFTVEEDGEYDIYFSAQRYVFPGLCVSASTLVVILLYLFVFSKKKSSKI
jgi:hypothetical protein